MLSVKTVRDFTQIFDAYANFEERETAAKMNEMEDAEGESNEDAEMEVEWTFAR